MKTAPRSAGKSFVLVASQVLLAAALVVGHGLAWPGPWGLAFSTLGMLLGVWAVVAMRPANLSILPDVRTKSRLVVSGPYRWVRHPMYTGLLVFCLGLVISRPSATAVMVWLALVATLIAKARYEERLLVDAYADYADYQSQTWQFVPGLI